MTLSRMHLGMLGVVSVFTGIIAPVVSNNIASFPFPLTDLQIPAYLVLLSLAIICILLAVRSWSGVRFFCLLVLGLIGYLFIVTWNGEVRTTSGILVPSLSWGWVFLVIGSGLLMSSMFNSEDIHETTTLSDHLIGWLGALSILILTGLIISISYIPKMEKSNTSRILETIFGSGSVEMQSGIIKSRPFISIDQLIFDRKRDALSFFTSSGTTILAIPSGRIFDQLPYTSVSIGNTVYTISAEGSVTTENGVLIGKAILPQQIDENILMYSGHTLVSIGYKGIYSYSGEYSNIEDIITSKIGNHIIWKSKTGTGYTIYRDGITQGKQQYDISHISISPNGESIMALVRETDGTQYIIKNGEKIEQIGTDYIEGTLHMNGNDRIYLVKKDTIVRLIYNGIIMDREYDEIREVFLNRDGGGYSYFGRPLGEQSYCLYTRYRGNLCGLMGYMNPQQTPDGLSIIYAGLKESVWGIYKNITPIIRNTGYPNRDDISRDYVFFDITNPSYYLFIRGEDDGYRLFKKGNWVNGIWKDVGLDTIFGYDNKIIMSAQDDKGWRIIEL